MSHSPERMSSYRRHFEDSAGSSYQIRVSSPSPTRRNGRTASAGFPRSAGSSNMRVETMGRRTVSAARKSRIAGSSARAGMVVCVGLDGQAPIDLDVAAAENQEFLSTRNSEREEMIVLNDRLAVYINKVRSLEQQNRLLETEIEAYQNRFQKPTGLRLLYEEQMKELKKIAEQMRIQRDIALAAKDSTAAQLKSLKIKYEEAVESRQKAEFDIVNFRPDVDRATSSRIALEKQLEQLEVKIEFLKRVHQQEVEELMKQIYAAHASAQITFHLPDLATALKQIQAQYEEIASKNLQDMDTWYKSKFEDLTSKTTRHVDKVRGIRDQIAGAKKDIQNKGRDLDTMRTRNDALEAQIHETQMKYKKELEDLQARIDALQLELKSTKERIALHLREYQALLNVKMALEVEITAYRKLIEGEDVRLSGVMLSGSLVGSSMSTSCAGMSMSMGGGGMGGGGKGGGGKGGAGMSGAGMGSASGMGGSTAVSMAAGGIGGVGSGFVSGGGRVGGGGPGLGSATGGVSGPTNASGPYKEKADVNGAGGMGAGGHGVGSGGTEEGVGGSAGGAGVGAEGHGGMGADWVGGLGSAGTGSSRFGAGVGGGRGVANGYTRAGEVTGGSGGTNTVGGMWSTGGMSTDYLDGASSVGIAGDGGKGGVGVGLNTGILGAGMGLGSDGYDATIEGDGEQAVELTERRTVLIRTVKDDDEVLETDHHEQTYIITGAAHDTDNVQA